MSSTSSQKIVAIRFLDHSEGCEVLNSAWFGGKNSDQVRRSLFEPVPDGPGYVLARVPLFLIRPNESGDLYDGTANRARVLAYAKESIDTPVYLLFGARSVRNGALHANVMDGGHRVSAARLRGDASIFAILKQDHFELLSLHAAQIERQNLLARSLVAQGAITKSIVSQALHP